MREGLGVITVKSGDQITPSHALYIIDLLHKLHSNSTALRRQTVFLLEKHVRLYCRIQALLVMNQGCVLEGFFSLQVERIRMVVKYLLDGRDQKCHERLRRRNEIRKSYIYIYCQHMINKSRQRVDCHSNSFPKPRL